VSGTGEVSVTPIGIFAGASSATGNASAFSDSEVFLSAGGSATGVATAGAIGYIYGQEWSDTATDANTWSDSSVGPTTWTDTNIGPNTWSSETISVNVWAVQPTGSNEWRLQG